jgi:hypothetical protein
MFRMIKLRATQSLRLRIGTMLMKLRRVTRRRARLQAAQLLPLRMGHNVRAAKAARPAKKGKSGLLYGNPVPGKQGLVTSPFSPDNGYIDVRSFPPGTEVKDPYTGKIFLTP